MTENRCCQNADYWRERAEAAEAIIAALRNVRAQERDGLRARAEAAEAKLSAVLALHYARGRNIHGAASPAKAARPPAEVCPNCTDAYACGPCVWNAGPYTEDEIREAFEALGDETNQDDLMYRLHWFAPQRAVDTGSDPAAATGTGDLADG